MPSSGPPELQERTKPVVETTPAEDTLLRYRKADLEADSEAGNDHGDESKEQSLHPPSTMVEDEDKGDCATPQLRITFDEATDQHPKNDGTLYIPGPRDRDRGHPLIELNKKNSVSQDGTRRRWTILLSEILPCHYRQWPWTIHSPQQ